MSSKVKHKTLSFQPNILIGLEIEAEYNTEYLNYIEVADYHSERVKPFGYYFKTESDGSLSAQSFGYPVGETAEFISIPFNIDESKKVLKDFKETFIKRLKNHRNITEKEALKIPLQKYLSFNNTTGAHVHLSILNTDKELIKKFTFGRRRKLEFKGEFIDLKRVFTYEFMQNFKQKLKNNVNKKIPHVYTLWERSLNRGYARAYYNKTDFKNNKDHEREKEFNLTGSNTDIEYRGFTLRGVNTWTDFFKIYEIFFKTLKTCLYAELRKTKPFNDSETLRLNDTAIKDFINYNKVSKRTRRRKQKVYLCSQSNEDE